MLSAHAEKYCLVGFVAGLASALTLACTSAFANDVSFGSAFFSGLTIPCGVAFGIATGVLAALQNRPSSTTVYVGDPSVFVSQVTLSLAQRGFYPQVSIESAHTFQQSLLGSSIGGRVTVAVIRNEATIVGPHRVVSALKGQFIKEDLRLPYRK